MINIGKFGNSNNIDLNVMPNSTCATGQPNNQDRA